MSLAPQLPVIKPPFWKTTTGSLLIAGIGSVIVLVLMIGGIKLYYGAESAKAGDVRITSCEVRDYTAVVGYIVVNSTRTTQSYRISFEVRDSDGTRVGDAGQIVQDVAPGEAVRGDRYVGISSARAPSCVVADVS